jgi:hypothetical protein
MVAGLEKDAAKNSSHGCGGNNTSNAKHMNTGIQMLH